MADRENGIMKLGLCMIPLLAAVLLNPHGNGRSVRRAVHNMESSCYTAFETIDIVERAVADGFDVDEIGRERG